MAFAFRPIIIGILLGAFLFFVPFSFPFLFLLFFLFLITRFFLAPWRGYGWWHRYDDYPGDILPIDGGYFHGRRGDQGPAHTIPVQ